MAHGFWGAEHYVDPSIAGNSGTGTSIDPYGDLQYAFDTATKDATDGDVFHILAGTAEVLAAPLDLTTFGQSTSTAPLALVGYTTTIWDGGQAEIDCNGAEMFNTAHNTQDGLGLYFLEVHNGGSTDLIRGDRQCICYGCKVHNCTGSGIYFPGTAGGGVFLCELYDITGNYGIYLGEGQVAHNWIGAGAGVSPASAAIYINGVCTVHHNIIHVSPANNGIHKPGGAAGVGIFNNSILGDAVNNGSGIHITGDGNADAVFNNLIEGFSGSSGNGIYFANLDSNKMMTGHNSVFNCTTAFYQAGLSGFAPLGLDEETLGVTPFAKSGADTFANRFEYFSPVATGNVSAGYPTGSNEYRGAIQPVVAGAAVAILNSRSNNLTLR